MLMAFHKMRLVLPVIAAAFLSTNLAEALPIAAVQMMEGTNAIPAMMRAGGVHAGHNVYRGGHNAYRGGHNTVVVGGRGAWGRGYRWAPGGAIAAGAAIGFVVAASAAAYATTRPPAPGLCWYYTDPSQRSGFWDVCP
jgi:hypothetical protein